MACSWCKRRDLDTSNNGCEWSEVWQNDASCTELLRHHNERGLAKELSILRKATAYLLKLTGSRKDCRNLTFEPEGKEWVVRKAKNLSDDVGLQLRSCCHAPR